MSEKQDSFRAEMSMGDALSEILQVCLNTQSYVQALSVLIIETSAKDKESAVKLAEHFEKWRIDAFRELGSKMEREKNWSDIINDQN